MLVFGVFFMVSFVLFLCDNRVNLPGLLDNTVALLFDSSTCRQIKIDSKFLESEDIMDYSLLLGVHYRAPQHLRSLMSYSQRISVDALGIVAEDGKFGMFNHSLDLECIELVYIFKWTVALVFDFPLLALSKIHVGNYLA